MDEQSNQILASNALRINLPTIPEKNDERLETVDALLINLDSADLAIQFPNSHISPSCTPSRRRRAFKENSVGLKRRSEFFMKALRENSELNKFFLSFRYVLHVYFYVKNWIYYQSYRNLKSHHYALIKDASIILENEKRIRARYFLRKTIYHDIKKKLNKFLKKLPLFDPDNLIKIFWDLFVFLLLFFKLIVFSLESSFQVLIFEETLKTHLINFVVQVTFLDILFTLNTELYISGNLVKSRSLIAWHYLKRYFIIDLGTIFSLLLNRKIKCYDDESIFFLILIPKILLCNPELALRIRKILLKFNKTVETAYDLFVLGVSIVVAGHSIACIWHFIGNRNLNENPDENSWIKEAKISDHDWKVKYVYSIYWSFTTMLTVGYGDITPQNLNEIIFNLFAMMFGCVIFGYSLNSIGEILRKRNKIAMAKREKANVIRKMASGMNLSSDLENKIMKYMEFYWEKENNVDPKLETQIMNQLSSSLREEISFETKFKALNSIPIFKKLFSDKTILTLANMLKKIHVPLNEYVCKHQSRDDSLYIIEQGQLELVINGSLDHSTTVEVLAKNNYFGLEELFTGFARRGGVVSKEFSVIYQLTRQDFLSIISKEHLEYEKFCRTRDDLILYQSPFALELKCRSCGKFKHSTFDCPFIKYVPNRTLIISKYQHRRKNALKKIKRKTTRKKYSTLVNLNYTSSSLQDYLQDQEEEQEFKDLKNIYVKDEESLQSSIDNLHDPLKVVRFYPSNSIENRNGEKAHFLPRSTSLTKIKKGQLNSKYNTELNMIDIKGNDISPKLRAKSKNKKPSVESIPVLNKNTSNINTLHSSLHYEIKPDLFRHFDDMKIFKFYYPEGNVDKVITKIRTKAVRLALRKFYQDK